MLRLIKFGFKGVGSFGNKWKEIHFGNGITQISGVNGSGKSTLLECIFFALYGAPFQRETINELISWQNGKKSLEVSVWLSKNKTQYKIWRTLYEEKLFKVLDNGEENEITGFEGKIGFQKEIDRILGIDQDTARRILFISADNTKPFPELKTQEKRDFIEDYFRLGVIGKMESMIKNKRTKLNSTIEILKNSYENSFPMINFLEKKLAQEKLNYENTLKEHEQNIQNEQTKKQKLQNEKQTAINTLYEEQNNIKDKLNILKQQNEIYIQNANQKIKLIENEIENKKSTLQQKKENAITNNKNIENQIVLLQTELENQIEKTKKEHNEQEQIITNNIKTINQKLENLYKQNTEIDTEITTLKNKQNELRQYLGGVNRLAEIKLKQEQILKEKNKLLNEKQFLKENTLCPYCKTNITEEHRKTEIERINNIGKTLQNEYIELNTEKTQIEVSLSNAESLDKDITLLQLQQKEINQKITELDNDLIKINATATKENNLENKLKLINLEFTQKINNLKNSIIDIEKIEMEINKLDDYLKQETLKITENAKNIYQNIINEHEQKLQLLNQKIEQTINKYDDLINLTDKTILNLVERKIDCSAIENTENELKKAKDLSDDYHSQYLKAIEELKIIETGCEVLGDKGIKPYFIKTFVPVLNKKVSELLRCFSLPVHIEFDEQLNMKLLNLLSPKEVKYRQHSKGEKRRITTAILLSFIDIVSEQMGWHCDQLFFDEFLDDGMDEVGMEVLIDILRSYSEQKGIGITVVSHKAKNELFDRIFMVSKNEDGFSDVVVKE